MLGKLSFLFGHSYVEKHMEDSDGDFFFNVGDKLLYSSQVFGSVGITYKLIFDDSAFEMTEVLKYKHPEEVRAGMCGADDASLLINLTCKRKGVFTVRAIHGFRGNIEKEFVHKITVS